MELETSWSNDEFHHLNRRLHSPHGHENLDQYHWLQKQMNGCYRHQILGCLKDFHQVYQSHVPLLQQLNQFPKCDHEL